MAAWIALGVTNQKMKVRHSGFSRALTQRNYVARLIAKAIDIRSFLLRAGPSWTLGELIDGDLSLLASRGSGWLVGLLVGRRNGWPRLLVVIAC